MMEILCERNSTAKQNKETTDDKVEEDRAQHEKAEEQKLMDEENQLVSLLEQRLQFILRSLTKLFLSKSPVHNKKEYVVLKCYYIIFYLSNIVNAIYTYVNYIHV